MSKQMICINCPMGCRLTVDDSDKNNIIVTGNNCVRGKNFAISEVLDPKRMVTGSVKLSGGILPLVSVKTAQPIPKQLVFEVLQELKGVTLQAPCSIGQIALKNVCGCGVDVVVTKNVPKAH